MRTLFFELCLIGGLLCAACGQRSKPPIYAEEFAYDERVHDFGEIRESDGPVSHAFTFTNKGQQPISISQVSLGCSCTRADFSPEPVPPGATTTITLTYNPTHRPGHFSKEAVVLLNGGTRYTRIWVRGDVLPMRHPIAEDHPYHLGSGLWVSQERLSLLPSKEGQTDSVRLLLANATDQPMTISWHMEPAAPQLQLPDTLTLQPDARTHIYIRYSHSGQQPSTQTVLLTPIVNRRPTRPLTVIFRSSDR